MPTISPQAAIDPSASIADDVEIGPFCVVGPQVTLGPGCKLLNNVTLIGHTTVGSNNTFYPNCVVGAPPQDKKYRGGLTRLEIGDNNDIREAVTIHTGTEKGGWVTRVGSHNLLMVNCHVGHDAQIGNGCVIANNVMIAGHIHIGNGAWISGGVGIHHYVTIGDHAYLGGYSRIHHDVPPFMKVDGSDKIRGINAEGLKRAGYAADDIEALETACRKLFAKKEKPLALVLADYNTNNGLNPHVKRVIDFLHRRNQGKHGRYLESLRAK
ncbi:MAG TPA: acyl-ACP--UDP-N-acetylglucosamine O-acyltransferase [Tepidisphaeraceae bacterium]|jgi:UDP-N-acetylglucosamine acyltransferase|nr:acyl-ACP--UDP-N-acetylglucosamine O-acyltransferase [Tepidisphaeraceae bacterium]